MNHFCLKLMLSASLVMSACGQAQLPLGDETREKCKSLELIPPFPTPDQIKGLEEIQVTYKFAVENSDGSQFTETLYLKSKTGDVERITLDQNGDSPHAEKVLFAPRDSQLCRATLDDTPLREVVSTKMHFEIILADQDGIYELSQLQSAQAEFNYVFGLFADNTGITAPPVDHLVINTGNSKPITVGLIQETGNRIDLEAEAASVGHYINLNNLKSMNVTRVEIPQIYKNISMNFDPRSKPLEVND